MYLRGDLTCFGQPSASLCSHHLGTRGRGTSRAMGDWAGAQVIIHGSREHERVTGSNDVTESFLLYSHQPRLAGIQSCWPKREPLLHLGVLLQPVISRPCQRLIPMFTGRLPAYSLICMRRQTFTIVSGTQAHSHTHK